MRNNFGNYGNKNGIGLDVLSLDITRGRDHGVAPYHKYFQKVTSVQIKEWLDFLGPLSRYVKKKILQYLELNY